MMGFFSRLIQKQMPPVQPMVTMFDTQYGRQPPSDEFGLVDRYRSWVYRCASFNAQAVADQPLKVYVRGTTARFQTRSVGKSVKDYLNTYKDVGDVTEITDPTHPLVQILDNANPYQTGIYTRFFTQLHKEITGNGYWVIVSNALGTPVEIWPVMSQYMRAIPHPTKFIDGWWYGTEMDKKRYDPDEVLQFAFPNPSDLYYGMGPLQAAISAVDRHTAVSDYQNDFFRNSARADFALLSDKAITESQSKRILQDWLNKFKGKNKRHLPVVMQGGLKVQELTYPPVDTGMLDVAKYSREEIAQIFGIPPTMIEVSASRAEAEQQANNYARYTLLPRLRANEEVINEQFANLFDDKIFVAYDNPVTPDRELAVQENDLLAKYGCISKDELRAKYNMDPMEGGDMMAAPSPSSTPVQMDLHDHSECKADSGGPNPPLTEKQQSFADSIEEAMRKQRDIAITELTGGE